MALCFPFRTYNKAWGMGQVYCASGKKAPGQRPPLSWGSLRMGPSGLPSEGPSTRSLIPAEGVNLERRWFICSFHFILFGCPQMRPWAS